MTSPRPAYIGMLMFGFWFIFGLGVVSPPASPTHSEQPLAGATSQQPSEAPHLEDFPEDALLAEDDLHTVGPSEPAAVADELVGSLIEETGDTVVLAPNGGISHVKAGGGRGNFLTEASRQLQEQSERRGLQTGLSQLQAALDHYIAIDTGAPPCPSGLTSTLEQQLKQDTPHQRLHHIWLELSNAVGFPGSSASREFHQMWSATLKTRLKAHKGDIQACVAAVRLEWLRLFIDKARAHMNAPQSAGPMLSGPVPMPVEASSAAVPEIVPASFPGYVTGFNHIKEYISISASRNFLTTAPPPIVEIYEDMVIKAMQQHATSPGNAGPAQLTIIDLQSSLNSVQQGLHKMQQLVAQFSLWTTTTGNPHRPDKKRQALKQSLARARYAVAVWFQGLSQHERRIHDLSPELMSIFDGLDPLALRIVATGRKTLVTLLEQLRTSMKLYSDSISMGIRNAKRNSIDREIGANHGIFAITYVNPLTAQVSFDECSEFLLWLKDENTVLKPFTVDQLLEILDSMKTLHVLSIKSIIEMYPPSPKFDESDAVPSATWSRKDIINQIVEYAPCMCIALRTGAKAETYADAHFLSICSLADTGSPYFWSLLSYDDQKWAESGMLDVPELQDMSEDVAEAEESILGHRQRAEHTEFGEALVKFVWDFINTRGQGTTSDVHRLRATGEVFGAPVRAIAKAARAKGFQISKSTIWRMLSPKRVNSVGPQRGAVEARPAPNRKGVKIWHPRGIFSATLMKFHKQFLTQLCSQGCAKVAQLHVDDMSKTPLYISATPNRAPKGFMLKCQDGQPAFDQADHTFPLEQRMLIATGGIVVCAVPSDAVVSDGPKPAWPTARPAAMHAYVRPHKFMRSSAVTHMEDLYETVEQRGDLRNADVVLVGADNGPDYSTDSPVIQHLLFRLFRKHGWVMCTMAAQAPYHSALHWEIEGQWPQARRVTVGQHFGRSAYDGDPALSGEAMPNVCKKVSEQGCEDWPPTCICARPCRCDGKCENDL